MTKELVPQLLFEIDVHDAMDAGVAAHEATVKRCACCVFEIQTSVHAPFVEAWDGKLFCRGCAFGVVKTGYCTLHENAVYPDVAGQHPHLSLLDYPDEFVPPMLKDRIREQPAVST